MKSTRTAPKRERTSEPNRPRGSPRPPIWGKVGGGELLRRQAHPLERPRADRDRPCDAGAPQPGELHGRPGLAEVQSPGQTSVNGRLPCAGVEDEGEGSPPADADVDRLGHLAVHRADRQGDPLPSGRPRRGAAAPGGGRWQGEGDRWLNVHPRVEQPAPIARGWDAEQEDGSDQRRDDRRRAVADEGAEFDAWRQRTRASRAVAMAIRNPRTTTASGTMARRHPRVVRTVKRRAERWCATIIR